MDGRRGIAPAGFLLHIVYAVTTGGCMDGLPQTMVPLRETRARQAIAFFMKSLRKHLLQSGIVLIFFAFISTSAWCVM